MLKFCTGGKNPHLKTFSSFFSPSHCFSSFANHPRYTLPLTFSGLQNSRLFLLMQKTDSEYWRFSSSFSNSFFFFFKNHAQKLCNRYAKKRKTQQESRTRILPPMKTRTLDILADVSEPATAS